MKRHIAVLLVALYSICAWSQSDFSGTFRIVPRFDAGANFYKGEKPEVDWGNSGLYTELEQNFSSSVKFHLLNLWVNPYPQELYQATFHANVPNWMPICSIEFDFSNFYVSLGKDYIGLGGFENDPSDYDFDYDQLTPFNSGVTNTQWGGMFGWVSDSENTELSIAVTSSQFVDRPFANGQLSFSGIWRGNYGPLSTIWGVSAVGTQKGKYQFLATLGQRLTLGGFSATFDWFNTSYPDPFEERVLPKGHTFHGELAYDFGGRGDVALTGSYILAPKNGGEYSNSWLVGAKVHIYPLKSRNLKISLTGAYDNLWECWDFRAGLLYYFSFDW